MLAAFAAGTHLGYRLFDPLADFLPHLPERPDNNKVVVSNGKSQDASDNRKKGEEGSSWIEVGGNAFDTAHIYGGGSMEKLLGEWHRKRNNLKFPSSNRTKPKHEQLSCMHCRHILQ